MRCLGYLCDSLLLAFVLPEDKKLKFKTLRESILSQDTVDLKTLQRFAGKTTSFQSRYQRLVFILAPRSVLSHPASSPLISPLESREICEGKSFIGDFWTTGKVASPGSKRGMLS